MKSMIQKAYITAISCFITVLLSPNVEAQQLMSGNQFGLTHEQVKWMKDAAQKQLDGCRVKGAGDTYLHTPDGVGNYKALWTRDFYYMVEYAGDLLDPVEIKASIHYLLNGQREDGCIPDRVNLAGQAVYSPGPPGKPMSDNALDNGPFMCMLVCSYVQQYHDEALFKKVEPLLSKALDFVSIGENGLVYNYPENPQCVYGFTDIVLKTGNLLFSSLLYYKSNLEMYQLCKKYECGEANVYKERFEKVKRNINTLWNDDQGMFWAADIDCKQLDVWGSAYAVEIGITSKQQSGRISEYLVKHLDEIALKGQIRHLPLSEGPWDKLFKPCEEGTYQNGAFWATPLAWVIPTLAISSPDVASIVLKTVIQDFQENGINECINEGYVKVPNFVVSACNVYGLTR
jgi:hypothetical protein